ncbi:hypothetical protein [Phaeovulum sp. W22_SRMD_FR3]|uniref:hypothetical protein n=1 Tax=Phaeovulum sp. W22_SRMD_FR3 TaxID=3240274 RepID=UPI003F9DB808
MPQRPRRLPPLLICLALPVLLTACTSMSDADWPTLLPTDVILAMPAGSGTPPGVNPETTAAEEARALTARAAALQARATRLRNQ